MQSIRFFCTFFLLATLYMTTTSSVALAQEETLSKPQAGMPHGFTLEYRGILPDERPVIVLRPEPLTSYEGWRLWVGGKETGVAEGTRYRDGGTTLVLFGEGVIVFRALLIPPERRAEFLRGEDIPAAQERMLEEGLQFPRGTPFRWLE